MLAESPNYRSTVSTMTTLTMSGWNVSCFTSLLAFAFALYHRFCPDHCSVLIDTSQPQEEYDFIVIGAGSAGAVVVNRLSECCNFTVLLLEAGGQETDLSDIPALAEQLRLTQMDWNYTTEPPKDGQAYCLAMSGHKCTWPRGRVVGGSSTTNFMLYIRGNKNDYDDWEALGNVGWGYDNVLKYFLKSENNSNCRYLRTPYHSSDGYQSVQDVPYTTPLVHAFIEAGEYLGYKRRDVNGKSQAGFTIPQGTIRNGSRCSTAKAFLRPIKKRPNFSLSMFSFVTKIGLEVENSIPRARTVSFIKERKEYVVRAKKEIILSAGALNSPKILMLSGIGPKKHLNDLGIKCLKNLPVGYNLQDHLGSLYLTFKVDKNVTNKPSVVETPDSLMKYIVEGKGPLTALDNVEGTAFVYSKYANRSRAHPDVQILFVSQTIFNGGKPFGGPTYNIRPDYFNGTGFEDLSPDGNYFLLDAILLRPKSTGRITLRSKYPYDPPIINPNYFARQEDIKVLVDGYRMCLTLVAAPPFQYYNATPIKYPLPGCEKFRMFSDEYFECSIRYLTQTTYHPSCTCPMGVGANAVVDPRLRVIGVKGLRVIDASVMPNITSGNLNAPTIMIGEKGSDLIKQDWKCTSECTDVLTECEGDWRCSRQPFKSCFKCDGREDF